MADNVSQAPTLTPSDSTSQAPAPQEPAKSGGKAGGKKSAKNAIAKDTPPGAVQVPKGGQNKTGKSSPLTTATIQLTGWEELDLCAMRTETIPTFTVDANPYVDLVDSEFDRIAARCPSVGKFIPFALFRYYCMQLWWYRSLWLHKANGRTLTADEKNFLNCFGSGEDYVIPTHIAQYLANMGNFIQGGETYFFRKLDLFFTGKADDEYVDSGWLDCGNNSTRVTTGEQFWAYAQVPVPGVFATTILNEIRGNAPGNQARQPLAHVNPDAEEGRSWKETNNIVGWMTHHRMFNHSSHRSTYVNLGWGVSTIPSDVQTSYLFSPASMRWMSDRLSQIKELKTYPAKQIALSVMGTPAQAYWLESPDKFYSYDWNEFKSEDLPRARAAGFTELALTSRFSVDVKAATPAYTFGYRLSRDKVVTGFTGPNPNIANRSNHQPWIYVHTVEDDDDVIHDPPAAYMAGMNNTWIFGSQANLNINRFQTQVLRRDDAVTRSLTLAI